MCIFFFFENLVVFSVATLALHYTMVFFLLFLFCEVKDCLYGRRDSSNRVSKKKVEFKQTKGLA